MSFMSPSTPAAPMIANVDLPPPPQRTPPTQSPGQKPQRKSMQTSFLGASAVPQQQQSFSGKTLLGQ